MRRSVYFSLALPATLIMLPELLVPVPFMRRVLKFFVRRLDIIVGSVDHGR